MLAQRPTAAVVDTAEVVLDRLWNAPLFTIANTAVTPATLVTFGIIVLATFWLSWAAQKGVKRALGRSPGRDPGAIAITARLLHYVVLLFGLGIALQTLGVNLGALFTAGAFFAVAIGFAMQNVAQNFVAGIILLVERTIKPGDVLEVDSRVVRVTRMGMRATVARTRDEEDVIIPNSELVQNTVTNYTLRDVLYRLRAEVGVSYGSDLAHVKQVLFEAASAFPERLPQPEPRVLLTGFGDSSVDFEVHVWIQDPWRARMAKSDLNEAIWWALKRGDITIPFPQRDLHLVSADAPLRVAGAGRDRDDDGGEGAARAG